MVCMLQCSFLAQLLSLDFQWLQQLRLFSCYSPLILLLFSSYSSLILVCQLSVTPILGSDLLYGIVGLSIAVPWLQMSKGGEKQTS